MKPQLDFQRQLSEHFAEQRVRNPSFSVRGFARKLGMNSGAVSAILNGKRRVSAKVAENIAERLGLDPEARSRMIDAVRDPKGGSAAVPLEYEQLSADRFRMISEWYHFGILSLLKTRGFKSDCDWIAERLGIAPREARSAIERLERVGALTITPSGNFKRKHRRLTTSDGVPSASIRQAHANNLELAKRSLERDLTDIRDFSALTLVIDPKKLALAKEKIRKFQDEFAELIETGAPIEVYKLCVQLFPISVPVATSKPKEKRV